VTVVLLTSLRVVAPTGVLDPDVGAALAQLAAHGLPIAVVSNHPEPSWFKSTLGTAQVVFVERRGRQDGAVIREVAARMKVAPHDFIVLGASTEDVQMAKNGGAVLLAAGWVADPKVVGYGIAVGDIREVSETLSLISEWPGTWYYEGSEPRYTVRALSNVSGKNVTPTQEVFATKLVATIKQGGPRLQALLVVTARSLLMSGIAAQENLMWGVFPSSSSDNTDDEVLSDFAHRLRTTVSNVRLARRGDPLFLRHTATAKRSRGGTGERTDPRSQIETLHLNPKYARNVRGRNVVVLDDCTTYGVSFGVAAGFLRAAGAASISCVALGKFGNQLRYYEIDLNGDPFAPINKGQYEVSTQRPFAGQENAGSQAALRDLIK